MIQEDKPSAKSENNFSWISLWVISEKARWIKIHRVLVYAGIVGHIPVQRKSSQVPLKSASE